MELADAAATEALGAKLAGALRCGVIYLSGDLGAGKTTLARGLLRALGVTGTIRSPTYTLMEIYDTPERVVLHMDLYRLQSPLELHQLGLMDYPPERTLWLVEWPERAAELLPPADLHLHLQMQGNGRLAVMEGRKSLQIQL